PGCTLFPYTTLFRSRAVVVAIDEAHDLEVPALLGLAELLDCSFARSKQLQVILAGLPHLVARLASPELQGIRDRISAIASLSPLDRKSTRLNSSHLV